MKTGLKEDDVRIKKIAGVIGMEKNALKTGLAEGLTNVAQQLILMVKNLGRLCHIFRIKKSVFGLKKVIG